MTLRLNGTTSGYTEIDSAAIGNNNLLTLPTTSAGTLIAANSSGVVQMNSGYGSNANAYGCRAWVNLNGTGTVAIRASGNVSSITDVSVGTYTVNFTTAMVDANYSCVAQGDATTHPGSHCFAMASSYTAANVSVIFNTPAGARVDPPILSVAIFR